MGKQLGFVFASGEIAFMLLGAMQTITVECFAIVIEDFVNQACFGLELPMLLLWEVFLQVASQHRRFKPSNQHQLVYQQLMSLLPLTVSAHPPV